MTTPTTFLTSQLLNRPVQTAPFNLSRLASGSENKDNNRNHNRNNNSSSSENSNRKPLSHTDFFKLSTMNNANIEKNEETLFAKSFVEEEEIGPPRRPMARITGNKTYNSNNNNNNNNNRFTDANSNDNYNRYNNSYDTNSYNNNSDPPRRSTARITGNKTYSNSNNRYTDTNSNNNYNRYNKDTASYNTVNNNSYSNNSYNSHANSHNNDSSEKNDSDPRDSGQFQPRNDFARDRGKTGPNSRARGQRHRKPAFIFSDELIERSKLLQEFIRLGVDLRQWEKSKREKGKVPEEIMLLSWKVDVAPIIRHLREFGIEEKAEVARIFTKNPMILIFGPSVLKEKTDYLLKKKFTKDQIGFIIKRGLQFLSRSVEAMDGRFGFFQQSYYLSGDQIREVAAARPKIIFGLKTDYVKSVNFCLDKKLGFKPNEIREIFLTNPSIFKSHPKALEKKFALLNGEMGIPHQSMVKYPNLLKIPEYVIAQRHAFLSSLGKAVYDPFETDFTALTAFTDFHDEGFATKVAGVDFQTYDLFLRDNNFRVAKSRCDADFAIDADHDDRDDHDDDDDDEHHDSRHRDHRRVS